MEGFHRKQNTNINLMVWRFIGKSSVGINIREDREKYRNDYN